MVYTEDVIDWTQGQRLGSREMSVQPCYIESGRPFDYRDFGTLPQPAELTDEHPAASYGLPVLVIDGAPHGPGDLVGRQISLSFDPMPPSPSYGCDLEAGREPSAAEDEAAAAAYEAECAQRAALVEWARRAGWEVTNYVAL